MGKCKETEETKMAVSSTPSSALYPINSLPRIISKTHENKVRFPSTLGSPLRLKFSRNTSSSTRLNAGLTEIEPDLIEDKHDPWRTNGVEPEDFIYGEYDGAHTYHETNDKPTFWESLSEEYNAADPPTGFQALISYLFLPAVAAGIYYDAPGEYLFIGAGIFTVVFCIIEMNKPDYPHNFEPQIYTMDREARDKLLSEYTTMDIWDFNEKYGDVWDFTIPADKDDILSR